NVTDNETTAYIPGSGGIRLKNGVPDYTHKDHLGSPVAMTDASGAVLWRELYSPYGLKQIDPAANRDNEGYTGHIDDAASGLTYMQARYYDPNIGRFLSNDPVGFVEGGVGHFNRYSYSYNDPINFFDPDGRCAGPFKPGRGSSAGEFCAGAASVPGAYRAFGQHGINLASTDPSVRARAVAVNNALGIAARFFGNNPIESLDLVRKGVTENPSFATGRAAASIAVGVSLAVATRQSGGGAAIGGLVSVGNFSVTQVGSAIDAIDGLFTKVQAAGLNPAALSNNAVANVFYAGASGIDLNFDQKSGTVSASISVSRPGSRIKTTKTVDICTFDDNGDCK
ncbi:MAG: RHS repeat-associated core domain-containing protein, partial [Pseudomonadota bacterium]